MKPRTTSELIGVLVKHYGSMEKVNEAARYVWQDKCGNRQMLKVDALWKLYESLNEKEVPTC